MAAPVESVDPDVDDLLDLLPEECIETVTKDAVSVIIAKTPYRKLRARLLRIEGYPAAPCVVQLQSRTLADSLLKKLEIACNAEASKHKGSRHIIKVVEYLTNIVRTNKLLYAWDEVRDLRRLCKEKELELKVSETNGSIRMSVKGPWETTVVLRLPEVYPEEPPALTITSKSYHDTIKRQFSAQAIEVGRRCAAGFSAEVALSASNPIKPPNKGESKASEVRLTKDSLLSMKEDIKFLKKASDLKEFESAKKKGDGTRFAATSKARRTARRRLRKLTEAEMERDAAEMKEMEAAAEAEIRAAMTVASDVPTKSAFPMAKFLVTSFLLRLPSENCQVCSDPVFGGDPKNVARYIDAKTHRKTPYRVFCGHWFHYKCLDEFMTTPPFGKSCKVCERRVYHPNWPSDVKKLEKAWARLEERKREREEMADFMGLEDFAM